MHHVYRLLTYAMPLLRHVSVTISNVNVQLVNAGHCQSSQIVSLPWGRFMAHVWISVPNQLHRVRLLNECSIAHIAVSMDVKA